MGLDLRFGIVGCGLLGHKRAVALAPHRLVRCADLQLARAQELASEHSGCAAGDDWRSVVEDEDIDGVIVATTPDSLPIVGLAAIEAGKHVLIEKPGGRNAGELQPLCEAADRHGRVVKIGFNHRFHPGLRKAHQLFESGAVGALLYIRGRYGHGGRLGYEKEWRADPKIGGGGELLDQGSHLIDLARWFAGDFVDVRGHLARFFWDMPVEDNAFMQLTNEQGKVAWLHASWSEWKNLFSLEVFGRDGKLQVDGLGGSYGVERLTHYHMLPEMGPPETSIEEFPGPDTSWGDELAHFARCIEGREQEGDGGLEDAVAMLKITDALYARHLR